MTTSLERTISARFARQVDRNPEKPGLETPSRQLSYGELDAITDRLATRLTAAGYPAERPTGLLVDQAQIAVAMLGVAKAGGFYVPLEPSDPPEVLRRVMRDAGTKTLIADHRCKELASRIAGKGATVLELESGGSEADGLSPAGPMSESDRACILYTSGSLSNPKGVVFDHRGILHIVDGNTRSLQITSSDRIALVSSNAFIGTTATVFRTLLNGALLLPFDPRDASAMEFAEWLQAKEVTLIQMVPTLFRHLSGALKQKPRALSLRSIHLAGEVVDQQDLALFDACFPQCKELINEAGATETGAFSRLHIGHKERPKSPFIPVGSATEDKTILLLGPDGNPQTPGKVGRIAIQSRFLARGYWGREAESTEHFASVPGKADQRLFLTGDLGELDDQGRLTIAGRTDSQVKLRGRRLDLTDLESRLRLETDSQAAAVRVVQQEGSDPKLIAYIETNGIEVPGKELRLRLRRCLPDHMVPEIIVFLERFPLTPSGKIDRRSLPSPAADAERLNPYVAPRGDIEKALANFWARELALGKEKVGVTDDFLQLGGESIFAATAISYIRQHWSIKLSFRDFFDLATIAELARVIKKKIAV